MIESDKKLVILAADDDAGIRRLYERILSKEYDLTVVEDGREVMDNINGGKEPDVILCDVVMPTSGMRVYEEIQKTRGELTRRILFVTGGGEGSDSLGEFIKQKQLEGRVLQKTFTPEELRVAVKKVLSEAESQSTEVPQA